MTKPMELLATYLHLARASQQRRQPLVRDRLLVLSADLAARMGLKQIAAYCRHQILKHNPGHLLHRWEVVEDALGNERFHALVGQLRRRYPWEKVEQMLASLGIDRAHERETYYSDLEYAAALLGTSPEELDRLFGSDESA